MKCTDKIDVLMNAIDAIELLWTFAAYRRSDSNKRLARAIGDSLAEITGKSHQAKWAFYVKNAPPKSKVFSGGKPTKRARELLIGRQAPDEAVLGRLLLGAISSLPPEEKSPSEELPTTAFKRKAYRETLAREKREKKFSQIMDKFSKVNVKCLPRGSVSRRVYTPQS